ncbi:MAG: DUF349 domain-containing protein [Steroidobacteraceae bacterium]
MLSRLFRTPTPPPAPVAEIPPLTAEPAQPAIEPGEQQQLLRAIESGSLTPDELMRLAVEGQTTRLRQAAASGIRDPALWQALLPRLRSRDKAAYKLIKQRLDALLAEQRSQEQARSDAEALCASIERHIARLHDPLFAPTLSVYITRWQAVAAGLDAQLRLRGQLALDRGQDVVAAQEREVARMLAQRAEEQNRARALDAELLAQQQAAEEQAALELKEQEATDQAREAETHAEMQGFSEQQDAIAQQHAEIASLIRLSGAALARGETRKAAWFRQSLEAALSGVQLPPHLARSIEHLDTRLNELRQWKDYAAAPKRIELIEDVEALIGVNEAPETLVEHLRALRQEWRTINKGLAVEATAEAERFEHAFAAAFQPCQVYLAELAVMRRTNLAARRQVLERVLKFEAGLDAAQSDHSMLMRVVREAPQEWRRNAPVDRDAGRPLDAEFFSVLDRLRTRLNAWYAANSSDKQALIARASQLTATTADLAPAIEEVKQLQIQWKATGPVPHAQSEAMWNEFRALCNAVYDRRQQEFAQQAATLDEAKSAAVDLCVQIEQASQEGPADRPTGEARLREWQDAFHALGGLPRADARGLHERYQRAMTRYDSLIAGLAQRDAAAIETNALAAAQRVRAYQRAVMEANAVQEELKAAADAFIAGVPRWPSKGVLQALRQSLARAHSAAFREANDSAREQALRRLCLHAEILSGAATPEEDAALRRDQEMQLLRQGLGQARQADERVWDAMQIEWLGLDAAAPAVHDELERRFMRCMQRRAR